MKLRELLQQMQAVQKQIGSSQPYICGGTPRDRYLNQIEKISDVDITTGDKSVQYLSQEFGLALAKNYNVVTKNFEDGHSAIHIGNFKMDFSSNFVVDGIEDMLAKLGISNPTDMQKEMFSRDFTCNALLLSLDLKKVIDPTGKSFKDLKEKKIRTCLSPNITLTTNKNRVIRAVYLASKLGFDIDEDVVDFVRKNPTSVKISTPTALAEKLNAAFEMDGDRAAYNIGKMGIWNEIPITDVVKPYFLKKDTLMTTKKAYFQGGGGVNEPTPGKKKYKSDPAIVNQTRFKEPFYRNYDLYEIPGFEHIGPGSGWHALQNYKSVSEFLDDRRKRMKDKYKADDSWIMDSGEISKKDPSGIKARAKLLTQLVKNAIDFPVDDQISSTIDHDADLSYHSLEMGGMGMPLPTYDSNDIPPSSLEHGHRSPDFLESPEEFVEMLAEKYVNQQTRNEILGLPDGFDHGEEEDLDITDHNGYYEKFGPESLIYEDKWNI